MYICAHQFLQWWPWPQYLKASVPCLTEKGNIMTIGWMFFCCTTQEPSKTVLNMLIFLIFCSSTFVYHYPYCFQPKITFVSECILVKNGRLCFENLAYEISLTLEIIAVLFGVHSDFWSWLVHGVCTDKPLNKNIS